MERRRTAPNPTTMYPQALRDKDLALFSKPIDVGWDNELEFTTANTGLGRSGSSRKPRRPARAASTFRIALIPIHCYD